MGVGPAPWKLLRDQAAKDPELCSVAQKSLRGRRKESARREGLSFNPQEAAEVFPEGMRDATRPRVWGDTEVSLPPRSGTMPVGASLVRAPVAKVPRAGPVSVSENADVGSSFI